MTQSVADVSTESTIDAPYEEAMFCPELYLERQFSEPGGYVLPCMFCGKNHDVKWETSYRPQGTGTLITSGVCEGCRVNLKPKSRGAQVAGFVHVDDFIDDHTENAYARFVLDYFRRSAVALEDFRPFMEQHKLFCSYVGERFRVTGASRLGDICLSRDFERETGYELRVSVDLCSDWSSVP